MLKRAVLRMRLLWTLAIFPGSVMGDAADVLGEYSGFTIVAAKRIAGYVDSNGKRENSFEGCEYDRQIVFDDGTALACTSYHYHYAYHPLAAILIKTSDIGGQQFASVVMIVGDDAFEMRGFLVR